MQSDPLGGSWVHGLGIVPQFSELGDRLLRLVNAKHARIVGVVEVGGVVGNLVAQVDELRLDQGLEGREILLEQRSLARDQIAGVLYDAFADLNVRLRPGKRAWGFSKLSSDPQSLQVVLKAVPELLEDAVQLDLPGVSEGWMADVMGQGGGPL